MKPRHAPMVLTERELERTDLDCLQRLAVCALHSHCVWTGLQARAWLRALARRMMSAEKRFANDPPTSAGRAALVLAERHAEHVKRVFEASDAPMVMQVSARLSGKPLGRYEHVNWWSGNVRTGKVIARKRGPR